MCFVATCVPIPPLLRHKGFGKHVVCSVVKGCFLHQTSCELNKSWNWLIRSPNRAISQSTASFLEVFFLLAEGSFKDSLLPAAHPSRCGRIHCLCSFWCQDALRDSFAAFDQSGEGLIPASAVVELLRYTGAEVDPEEVRISNLAPSYIGP